MVVWVINPFEFLPGGDCVSTSTYIWWYHTIPYYYGMVWWYTTLYPHTTGYIISVM
jgi:hypothetical protein